MGIADTLKQRTAARNLASFFEDLVPRIEEALAYYEANRLRHSWVDIANAVMEDWLKAQVAEAAARGDTFDPSNFRRPSAGTVRNAWFAYRKGGMDAVKALSRRPGAGEQPEQPKVPALPPKPVAKPKQVQAPAKAMEPKPAAPVEQPQPVAQPVTTVTTTVDTADTGVLADPAERWAAKVAAPAEPAKPEQEPAAGGKKPGLRNLM